MTNATTTQTVNARPFTKPEPPYVYACIHALNKISTSSFTSNKVRALAIYYALCWVAADRRASVFRAARGAIGNKAGYKARSAEEATLELEQIGVIHIRREKREGKKCHEVNEYTLLAMRAPKTPSPKETTQNNGQPSPKETASAAGRNKYLPLKGKEGTESSAADASCASAGGGAQSSGARNVQVCDRF